MSDALIDYLVIGHITDDLVDEEVRAGGTVTYAGQAAQAMGQQTAVLTTHTQSPHPALNGLLSHIVPAEQNSTFRNIYTANGRVQKIHNTGPQISAEYVPQEWRNARVVHFGPMWHEIDFKMFDLFPNSFIGLTPQGLMRQRLADDTVGHCEWQNAEELLGKVTAVILSPEDLPSPDYQEQIRQWAPLMVVTNGWHGCTIYQGAISQHVPVTREIEVDPTGAGDIFAAAFFIRYQQTQDPILAAQFANQIAASTVTQRDLTAKLQRIREISH